MANMVYPGVGRPRARPSLEHDARAVRIALSSLRLASQTAQHTLEQHPEVAKYLSVMQPQAFSGALHEAARQRIELGELVNALRSGDETARRGN